MNRTSRAALLAVPGLTLLLAACGGGGHDGQHPASSASSAAAARSATGAPTGSASAAAASFNQQDVTFAANMVAHHRQAIQMADLAADRAGDPAVTELAKKIKAAQGPEISTLNGWLKGWGMPEPEDMSGMDMGGSMPGMMSSKQMGSLTSASGADFDRMFLTMMIAHHEGAVAMAKEQLATGQSADAKALASAVVKDQAAEIEQMRSMLG